MAILTTELEYRANSGNEFDSIEKIIKPLFNSPAITQFGFDIRENVVYEEPMYRLIPGDKITKAKTTCGWNPSGAIADLVDDKIRVREMSIELEECAKDFDGLILQEAKRRGVDRNDLTGTILQEIIEAVTLRIGARDLVRIAFLGDTANVSTDYNQTDGIIKKILAGVTAGDIANVHTPAAVATPAEAIAFLNALHYEAPMELQDLEDQAVKYLTNDYYQAYLQYLSTNNQLESSWNILQNGQRELMHLGVPVRKLSVLSKYLKADFAATKPQQFGIYTVPENITIATDQVSDFTTIDFWYEKKPQMNYLRMEYKLGTGIGWGELMAVGYSAV